MNDSVLWLFLQLVYTNTLQTGSHTRAPKHLGNGNQKADPPH